jgi:hypothetical protein
MPGSRHGPNFERVYYIALEMRDAIRADEIIAITRNEAIDVARGRLIVDSLFRLMAKEAPKRYGRPAEKVVGKDIAPQRPTDAP